MQNIMRDATNAKPTQRGQPVMRMMRNDMAAWFVASLYLCLFRGLAPIECVDDHLHVCTQ